MNEQIEALKMALNALYVADAIVVEYSGVELERIKPAILSCEEALAEAESESSSQPVAWIIQAQNIDGTPSEPYAVMGKYKHVKVACDFGEPIPLYTHPATWKSLSDDEINEYWHQSNNDVEGVRLGFTTQQHYFARAIEQALKEKNHG